MEFVNETGAIISPNKQILHLVDGTAGLTVFPQELLWNLHKSNPGIVYALSHVHPPGMTDLSHEDETTLLAQALSVYPFPSRMITIAEINQPSSGSYFFRETCYYLKLESKEEWIARGKGKRKWEIINEWDWGHELYSLDQAVLYGDEKENPWYGKVLLQRSYK